MGKIMMLYQLRVGDKIKVWNEKKEQFEYRLIPSTIIYDSGLKRTNKSWVIAFLQHIMACFRQTSITIKDVGGTNRVIQEPWGWTDQEFMWVNGGVGDEAKGIVLGTDDTTETNTDYALGAQIAHGTGSGEMQYDAHSYESTYIDSGNVEFELRRIATNLSGASITIKEFGKRCRSHRDESSTTDQFLIGREVPAPTAIPDTKSIEVRIITRTTT